MTYFASVSASLLGALVFVLPTLAGEVDPQQSEWHKKYKKQQNAPDTAAMLLNTESEPDLSDGFEPLFNGRDLSGWSAKGGTCHFEVDDGVIVGTVVEGSQSTYLSTDRTDFTDFIFTCDIKWEIDGNTGVMFRARSRSEGDREVVYGPQAEMEGITKDRGWSGGIYGQSCGGYFYPLWLTEHQKVRQAIKKDGWNRITIFAKGNVVRTWVNEIPAAHWIDDGSYPSGFFGLQVHKGKAGKILFRAPRVKVIQ